MPRRNEAGKRLSGSAERKIAAEQKATIEAAEKARIHTGSKAKERSIFSNLPAAPIGKPEEAVIWANNVLMVAMEAIVKDDKMPLESKAKLLSDMSGKLGMIRDKASEQKKINEYISKQQKQEGTVNISSIVAPSNIKKPTPQ